MEPRGGRMGSLGLLIGPTGVGKSTSAMNMPRDGVMVFGVTGKRMPFRTPLEVHRNATYRDIYVALKENKSKVYIIDDSTYLMQFDNFRRAKEKGYDKYVDMALNFQTLLDAAARTDDDTTVWFLHHPQFSDDGSSKPQTIGKMLDNQLCVEGLFDIVLECAIIDGKHVFITNEHGISKTPLGMFDEQVIPNDLYLVDKTVREFWGMAPILGGGHNAA